jgi:hypothetical protein
MAATGRTHEEEAGVMHGRAMPSLQDVRWVGTRHIVTLAEFAAARGRHQHSARGVPETAAARRLQA